MGIHDACYSGVVWLQFRIIVCCVLDAAPRGVGRAERKMGLFGQTHTVACSHAALASGCTSPPARKQLQKCTLVTLSRLPANMSRTMGAGAKLLEITE